MSQQASTNTNLFIKSTSEKENQQSQINLPPLLVVITALAIGLSLLGERLNFPAGIIVFFNLVSYAAGGFYGAVSALESLRERKIDVDMLMILAALGAAAVDQWHEGAILLFLFSLSNVLQEYAIGRSRQAIRSLFKLYPSDAKVRQGNSVKVVNVNDIHIGQIVLIEPGERIPVDGIVRGGGSAVDQSPITGESMPVEKRIGDKVFAGTLNTQGALDVEATQAATNTTLARIIKMVEEAQDSKAPTERFLEKFEQIYAGIIIAGVGLFIVIPPLLGWVDFESNFYRAMVLMTVASPCALVISTPAAFLSAIASAARGGVLFKGGAYLEMLAGIKAVAFDKTGTLTVGKPTVTDIVPFEHVDEADLLTDAAAVEARSEHPLAKAIIRAAQTRNLQWAHVEQFEAVAGRGAKANMNGTQIRLGSPTYMLENGDFPAQLNAVRERLENEGKTVILVQRDGAWLGLIALADELRPEAKIVIQNLQKMGIATAMLTGDNPLVAQNMAKQAGVTLVYAGLMPEDKVKILQQIQAQFGATAMVGDGVNDAPALAAAEVGIAMGAAGTDVALETADLVLMGDKLELIEYAISLSKKARRVVWQNITFSLAVIVLLVFSVFAAGLVLPLGVLGHEGSTVIVVLNGLISLLIWPEIQRRRSAI